MPKTNLSGTTPASDLEMKECDIIVVIDKSGSMGEASLRFQGKTKWEELREDVIAISREMAKHDDDGLTVISFSSGVDVKDGVSADAVAKLFAEQSPRGSTNLTDALTAACGKARQSAKKAVVMVFTDGSPDNAQSAMEAINAVGKELGRPRIGFVFIQVGNDPGAAAFLDRLDNDLAVDVVATVGAKDAENLSPNQLVWLAQNA